MKVVCVGDLAGLTFQLVRSLRKIGVDAYLYVPESCVQKSLDVWMVVEKPSWVITWNGGLFSLFARLLKMRDFDIIQTVGMSNAYAYLSGKPFVAYSAGSDLRKVAFQKNLLGLAMRFGFRNARQVFISNSDQVPYLNRLGVNNYTFIPQAVDLDKIRPTALFSSNVFTIFNPSSMFWEVKGTDKLVKAFASFSKGRNVLMRMVKWGPDHEKTLELIKSLGISDKVEYIAPVKHSNLFKEFQTANLVCDQFVYGAMGLISLETLASAKPLLTYLEENSFMNFYSSLPPVLNACSVEEIEKKLVWAFENSERLNDIGKKSREWIEFHHGDALVAQRVLAAYELVLKHVDS